jgi:hypothetical protein
VGIQQAGRPRRRRCARPRVKDHRHAAAVRFCGWWIGAIQQVSMELGGIGLESKERSSLIPPVRPVVAGDHRQRERDTEYTGIRPDRAEEPLARVLCFAMKNMSTFLQRVFRIYGLGSRPRRAHMSLSSYYMNVGIRFQSLDTAFILQP